MLTPPSSPFRNTSPCTHRPQDVDLSEPFRSSVDVPRSYTYTDDGIIVCPYEVALVKDQKDRSQIFGHGAWSTVFKGTCYARSAAPFGLMTPPSQAMAPPPLLVAVKYPARKDAVTILRNEAKTLSRLQELDPNEQHIATFYGIIDKDSSIVMAAHPRSLKDHIRACAQNAASMPISHATSPVVGNTSIWLDLAEKLIDTLDWMHNDALIVHGDIKPGNILLRPVVHKVDPQTRLAFDPLFIDFSSSQRLDTQDITPNTLSAVTKEYTAPELLTVAVMKDPNSCATPASDVFSLAVTLVVAATGDPTVYTGCSAFQRQYFATQGTSILGNLRSFSNRLPRQGVVSRVLERAVLRKDLGRISTDAWKELVADMRKDIDGTAKW